MNLFNAILEETVCILDISTISTVKNGQNSEFWQLFPSCFIENDGLKQDFSLILPYIQAPIHTI